MNKPHARPAPASWIDDPSAAQRAGERPTQIARRRVEETRLERRRASDLEHAPTQVMPPPPRVRAPHVAPARPRHKAPRAGHRAPGRVDDVFRGVVSSAFDIEPPALAHGVDDDDDDSATTVATPRARPDEAAWASAVTRSMARVWRDASMALDASGGHATASLIPLETRAHAPAPTTGSAPTVVAPPFDASTHVRRRRRARSGASVLCALIFWLIEPPLVADGVAWGARGVAAGERTTQAALATAEGAAVRARLYFEIASRLSASVR